MFTIAHLSDVHLSPLPRPALTQLWGKRLSGFLSWQLNRHKIHKRHVLDAITRDIAAVKPDHIAFTGDLVNIALPAEFTAGEQWLKTLGSPRDVSMVPGNHDAYTPSGLAQALADLRPWMESDSAQPGPQFPFARYRRNVAIIGLCTGVPTPVFNASGTLGQEQLKRLALLLQQTRSRGFARVVMLHHPPAPGLTIPRKALTDAADLQAVLARHGAELVLYGHNHLHQSHVIDAAEGPVPCFGVPSASALPYPGHPPAAWNQFTLRRTEGNWRINAMVRSFDPATGIVETSREFTVSGA
ncbi:MAG: metallophosphoesterase [Aestuariivirgaceae bacterium]|nr:metallophosphoesterase [Aestuariivirgaceae bacterium]